VAGISEEGCGEPRGVSIFTPLPPSLHVGDAVCKQVNRKIFTFVQPNTIQWILTWR